MNNLFELIATNLLGKQELEQALASGMDVNQRNEEGDSLLSLACKAGNIELVQILLDVAADVDNLDEEGFVYGMLNPLHIASEHNNGELVKLLLEYGANVYVLGEGNVNALNRAVHHGNFEIVSALFKHKQQVDARTRKRMRTNPDQFDESYRELMLSEEKLIDVDTAEDIHVQIKALIAHDDNLKRYEHILFPIVDSAQFIEWHVDVTGGNADDKIEYMKVKLGTHDKVNLSYMYLFNWSFGDSMIHVQYDDQHIQSLQQSEAFPDESLRGLAVKLGLAEMPLAVFGKFIMSVVSRRLHKQYSSFDEHGMYFRVNSNAD